MSRSVRERIDDIGDAIAQIRSLLSGRSFDQLSQDRVATAAFERFLDIVSEASRHIPEAMKATEPEIPWRRIADIGNWLRHVYDRVDPELLWHIHEKDLDPLEEAIKRLARKTPRVETD